MKPGSAEREASFDARFQAFWNALESIERRNKHVSLDPGRRYWIDTYPPIPTVERCALPEACIRRALESVSRECGKEWFSLYFHIGFCRRRCAYCRQYQVSLIGDAERAEVLTRYVARLKEDVDTSLQLFPFLRDRTRGLYFGGGTPSLLPPRLLGSLLEHLVDRIALSRLTPQSTFEVNPETVDDGTLAILQAMRMPRISVGVQSFDTRLLQAMGRGYSSADVSRVVERVAAHGFTSVNVDVINGFPAHRDFGHWKREIRALERLFRLGLIDSVTLYPLHHFPGTRLACRREDAAWQARNMFFARTVLCGELGLHEGPIYWFRREKAIPANAFASACSILGFGNSSYSSPGRWLLLNEPSLQRYLQHAPASGAPPTLPIRSAVRLTSAQVRTRSLLFAMRSGCFTLGAADLARMPAGWRNTLQRFLREGLLQRRRSAYALTDAGKAFAHQMPFYFFDRKTRADLEGYLDARLA